jgi:hypothetical protein
MVSPDIGVPARLTRTAPAPVTASLFLRATMHAPPVKQRCPWEIDRENPYQL